MLSRGIIPPDDEPEELAQAMDERMELLIVSSLVSHGVIIAWGQDMALAAQNAVVFAKLLIEAVDKALEPPPPPTET